MTPEQEAQLFETVIKTGTKMDLLVSDDGSKGQIPELRANHNDLEKTVVAHGSQLAYWKGAIAVIAFLLIVFGAVFATHLMGGH